MEILTKAKGVIFRYVLNLLWRVYNKPSGQHLLFHNVPYMEAISSKVFTDEAKNFSNPYFSGVRIAGREDVINNSHVTFVTGRFRSGSTLLWNILRDAPETTSYYEPLNEREWFNRDKRGGNVDNTHVGVDEYWKEYDGLDSLGRFFKTSWGEKQFYMTATSWEPDMMNYIDELIRSGNKRVVLQFNRLDFRLSWVRQYYPKAKIIHIYRHPREQWLSYIKGAEGCSSTDNFSSLGDQDFFYLRRWGRDLRYVFSFLDENNLTHPYELFYLIWRLSYNHGLTYSDYSVSMEDLSKKTETTLSKIFSLINIDPEYLSQALSKVKDTQPQKWQSYAENSWFEGLEEHCEAILGEYYYCKRVN